MTSRDFAFWAQGFFEISGAKTLNESQVDMIKRHLALVFIHEIDPSFGGEEKQEALNKVHDEIKKELKEVKKIAKDAQETASYVNRRNQPLRC